MVAARLQGDVGSCAASLCACLLEGDDLGVVEVVVQVRAFADDLAVTHQHAADLGIGRGQPDGRLREVEGALHVSFVLCRIIHAADQNSCFQV